MAVGTELLLGQIVDSNSAWIGEQLAAAGIESYDHRKVGDNVDRIVAQLRDLVADADAVVVCGGLGPTPDDVTRQALAELAGVPLERSPELAEHIAGRFASWGRTMPKSNLRQADVPVGATALANPEGTAPGLRVTLDGDDDRPRVLYAVPGVPSEMRRILVDQVVPDLLARAGVRRAIVSRVLKTWGSSESAVAELVAERVDRQTNPTIAFLARGIEGIWVRITASASSDDEAQALVAAEATALRRALGDLVFGVDDETMESVVVEACRARGWTLGIAESLTGGLVGARLAAVPGVSDVLRGSVASYATEVKRDLLGVTAEQVVSEQSALEMALGARRALGADVGIAVTGVAGPAEQDGQPVGTIWYGLALPGAEPVTVSGHLSGDRSWVRQLAAISLLDLLRHRLTALPASP